MGVQVGGQSGPKEGMDWTGHAVNRVRVLAQQGPARALTGDADRRQRALTWHPAEDSDEPRGEAVAGASVASRGERASGLRNPGECGFRLNLRIFVAG